MTNKKIRSALLELGLIGLGVFTVLPFFLDAVFIIQNKFGDLIYSANIFPTVLHLG